MMCSAKRLLGVLVVWLFCFNNYAKNIITINNQAEFDNLSIRLKQAINEDDNDIYVALSSGQYVYKERHFVLSNVHAPSKRIHIVGNNAVIVPSGKIFRNGDIYTGTFSTNSSWMFNDKDVDIWSDAKFADGLIEVVNPNAKECRLKCSNTFPPNVNVKNAYILITKWYQSSIYKIDKVKDNYIYFKADNLSPKSSVKGGYNINDDYYYKQINPRYKLCNIGFDDSRLSIVKGKITLPSGVPFVREGTADRFLVISGCEFNSFEIEGIKFYGNSNNKSAPAFDFVNNKCESILIHNCDFIGFRSNLINTSSSNVAIIGNLFSSCYLNGVQAGNIGKNFVVRDNIFIDMGKRMQNSFCVVCRGENYQIRGNKLVNYGYGGIGVGVWYKSQQTSPCSGIVENNELTFTESYIANIHNYGIMDSGAIYLWTKNDGAIIRNNYIHGYSGMGSNRGIFCDDGAYNYQIYGNVITGIANSYCIDSRRVSTVEKSKTKESGIEKANVNIVIRDNIVDGHIRFEAHEGKDNGCMKGANYVLRGKNGVLPKNQLKNVANCADDIIIDSPGISSGKIRVTSKSYKTLKKSKSWKALKRVVERE